jgi:hypothetical protein
MNLAAVGGLAGSIVAAIGSLAAIYKVLAPQLAKDASDKAKDDIRTFLTTFNVPTDLSFVLRHLRELFEIPFDRHHFSLRCMGSSALVTTVYFLIFGVLAYVYFYYVVPPPPPPIRTPQGGLTVTFTVIGVPYKFPLFYYAFVFSLIPDYFSLWKGRYALGLIECHPRFWSSLGCFIIDFAVSCALGVLGFISLLVILYTFFYSILVNVIGLHPTSLLSLLYEGSSFIIRVTKSHDLHAAIFFSAIVSSVWILLNVVAALLLRAIGGILNLVFKSTRWFYSIDKRPVEACCGAFILLLGIVIIAYTVICSVVWRT